MAAATMYATEDGANAKTGVDWANAMDSAALLSDMLNNAEAGDLYYVYTGTYTLTGNIWAIARDGTTTTAINVIGVSDQGLPPTAATGADRPTFAAGTYEFGLGDYWQFENAQGTGTGAWRWDAGTGCLAKNCKSTNSSGTAGRRAFGFGARSSYVSCEAIATNGIGIKYGNYLRCFDCYCHDSATGFQLKGYGTCCHCIADTCSSYGFYLASDAFMSIFGCTAYNCGIGINCAVSYSHLIQNSILDSCTTGVSSPTDYNANILDYNNYHGNTADVSNVTKGTNATAYDPDFEDAAGGDFRLKTGSSCLGAGFGISLGVGAASTVDQGAWQAVAGAGGGLLVHPGTAGGMRG